MMKFNPVSGHIRVLPEAISNTAKVVEMADGTKKEIFMGDRSKDEKVKAVHKGAIQETSCQAPHLQVGKIIIYYPFSANKIIENEVEYHVIHERDVMGYMSEVS